MARITVADLVGGRAQLSIAARPSITIARGEVSHQWTHRKPVTSIRRRHRQVLHEARAMPFLNPPNPDSAGSIPFPVPVDPPTAARRRRRDGRAVSFWGGWTATNNFGKPRHRLPRSSAAACGGCFIESPAPGLIRCARCNTTCILNGFGVWRPGDEANLDKLLGPTASTSPSLLIRSCVRRLRRAGERRDASGAKEAGK